MPALTTLAFRIRPIKGQIGTATQANPTGFTGHSFYFEIVDTGTVLEGIQTPYPEARVIGILTWDYFNSRWAVLFTQEDALSPNDPTTYVNNVQAIKDFMAGGWYPTPPIVTTDAVGDAIPYQASLPPIKG